jgi:hypothetical protein
MKRLIFFFAIAMFAACNSGTVGKGNIISEKRSVSSFHSIDVNAVAEVTFIQDNTPGLEVKSYENIVPLILTSVRNGVLVIESKRHIYDLGSEHPQIIIHVPMLDHLKLEGVGSINSEGPFNFNSVDIELSGVGSINISGHAGVATMINSGAGSIHCKNLLTDTTVAKTSGVGSIQCNVSHFLRATVSGVGSISYTGDPIVEKSVSGVGSVNKE